MVESPYRWLHRLGAGSSGEVWAAARGADELAVKILRAKPQSSHAEAIRREMRIGPLLLGHPGVVAVRNVETVGGALHLEMDWVRGPSLAQVIEGWYRGRREPFPASVAVPWVVQVLETLHWVASRVAPQRPWSFVHRDVKPANLLLAPSGRVRVTDFGIARAEVELGFQTTQTGIVKGSPRFMAPEVLTERAVDWRADQFSVGVVLYELLAGRPLYDGRDVAAILMKAMKADVGPALDALDAPPALAAVLGRMLALEADDRYADPHTAAEALSQVHLAGPDVRDLLDELLSYNDLAAAAEATGDGPRDPGAASTHDELGLSTLEIEDPIGEVTSYVPENMNDADPPTIVSKEILELDLDDTGDPATLVSELAGEDATPVRPAVRASTPLRTPRAGREPLDDRARPAPPGGPRTREIWTNPVPQQPRVRGPGSRGGDEEPTALMTAQQLAASQRAQAAGPSPAVIAVFVLLVVFVFLIGLGALFLAGALIAVALTS